MPHFVISHREKVLKRCSYKGELETKFADTVANGKKTVALAH